MMAYISLDQVVLGSGSTIAEGSPLFQNLVFTVASDLSSVNDCGCSSESGLPYFSPLIISNNDLGCSACSIYEKWREDHPSYLTQDLAFSEQVIPKYDGLAMGGNFEPFFQNAGVPSMSIKCIDQKPSFNLAHFRTASHR